MELITPEPINEEALWNKLRASIISILKRAFPDNEEKQNVIFKRKRINFACPICGDSEHDDSKKRGNIYTMGLMFKCYNKGSKECSNNIGIVPFLTKFGEKDNYTQEEINYLKENSGREFAASQGELSTYSKNFDKYSKDIYDISKYAVDRDEFKQITKIFDNGKEYKIKLVEISESMQGLKYARSRFLIPDNGDTSHLLFDDIRHNLWILNLTHDNKIVGAQYRMLNPPPYIKLRYITYTYEDIMLKMVCEPSEKETSEKMNKFSLVYNICNNNYNRESYIFEGSIDAINMSLLGYQSMATLTASTNFFLENALYWYDNSSIDKAGAVAATEMICNGYKVFLWKKFLYDYPEFSSCKDLNDMMKLKNGKLNGSIFRKYFSNEALDIVFI